MFDVAVVSVVVVHVVGRRQSIVLPKSQPVARHRLAAVPTCQTAGENKMHRFHRRRANNCWNVSKSSRMYPTYTQYVVVFIPPSGGLRHTFFFFRKRQRETGSIPIHRPLLFKCFHEIFLKP